MTAAVHLDHDGAVRLLAAILAGVPHLPGAACAGIWSAFDAAEPGEEPADVDYRHRTALATCRRCPALDRCAEWAAGLRGRDRPDGIIAGQIPQRKKETTP
ncbi:hypothetical protein A5649_09775 [Mycolicibacter heraklionensis]|uniref:4Fe-4S Wbl-type domain-containing protein n=1 Tax=Mycolicibacter heraklionensis TaxID=512402 RepID=A0AA91EVK2_9MYCO|nr:hypothetical protein [Mycolicibacter heraklionensis]OBK82134.1 hypothetical protein A5649_09775 [Mycolicibacter heraklionensis]